jgi:hypothetical protein
LFAFTPAVVSAQGLSTFAFTFAAWLIIYPAHAEWMEWENVA